MQRRRPEPRSFRRVFDQCDTHGARSECRPVRHETPRGGDFAGREAAEVIDPMALPPADLAAAA